MLEEGSRAQNDKELYIYVMLAREIFFIYEESLVLNSFAVTPFTYDSIQFQM